MGKSAISMVIFNSYVSHYQRVVGLWYGYYTLKLTGTQIFAWWIWDTGFPCGLTKSIQLPIDLSMAKYLPQIWLVNHYLVAHPTARKWVITPVINGISRVNPLITGVITHLLSGMSHQVEHFSTSRSMSNLPKRRFQRGQGPFFSATGETIGWRMVIFHGISW